MAYTDSLQIRYFVSTPINSVPGVILDVDSGNSAVRCPTGVQLEAFGVHVSTAGSVGVSAIFEVLIGKSLADGSPAGQGTITIPSRTLVLGERIECGGVGGRAINVLPGQYVRVSQIQQGTGSGAVEPYVVLRINGYTGAQPPGPSNPNSPLTIVLQ